MTAVLALSCMAFRARAKNAGTSLFGFDRREAGQCATSWRAARSDGSEFVEDRMAVAEVFQATGAGVTAGSVRRNPPDWDPRDPAGSADFLDRAGCWMQPRPGRNGFGRLRFGMVKIRGGHGGGDHHQHEARGRARRFFDDHRTPAAAWNRGARSGIHGGPSSPVRAGARALGSQGRGNRLQVAGNLLGAGIAVGRKILRGPADDRVEARVAADDGGRRPRVGFGQFARQEFVEQHADGKNVRPVVHGLEAHSPTSGAV